MSPEGVAEFDRQLAEVNARINVNAGIIKTYAAEFGCKGLTNVHFSSMHPEPVEVFHQTEDGSVFTDQELAEMIEEAWASAEPPALEFESSSPLRDEDDTDIMGRDSDPMTPGRAETWFRDHIGE